MSNSDDKRAEMAARVRNLIEWCRKLIKEHGKLIGKDPQQGQYRPLVTAHAFARLLVSVDLPDHASMLPLGTYNTHQEIIGLLNRYIPILQQHERRFSQSQDPSAPDTNKQPIAPTVVPTTPKTDSDRVGKAAMLREVVEWCKAEAGAIRALDRHSGMPPDSCRKVIGTLIRMLYSTGQLDLANRIDIAANDSPLRVIGLLAQTSADLERIAADLETAPQHAVPAPAAPSADVGSSAPAVEEEQPEPDGTHPPNRLLFHGVQVTLEPIPWRLADYMWNRQQAATDDVCEHVWSERVGIVPEHALKVAQGKVNKALETLGIEWRLGIKSGYVIKKKSRKSL